MLNTKLYENRSYESGKDFKSFYHKWVWRPSWSVDQHHVRKNNFLVPESVHVNFG